MSWHCAALNGKKEHNVAWHSMGQLWNLPNLPATLTPELAKARLRRMPGGTIMKKRGKNDRAYVYAYLRRPHTEPVQPAVSQCRQAMLALDMAIQSLLNTFEGFQHVTKNVAILRHTQWLILQVASRAGQAVQESALSWGILLTR